MNLRVKCHLWCFYTCKIIKKHTATLLIYNHILPSYGKSIEILTLVSSKLGIDKYIKNLKAYLFIGGSYKCLNIGDFEKFLIISLYISQL